MTRDEALQEIHRLMLGLPAHEDIDGMVSRLMERIAAHADPELLRDVLVEVGARSLLSGMA